MTRMYVATKIRLLNAVEGRKDEGQGALEYVGLILIAAFIVLAVWAAVKDAEIATKISGKVKEITGIGG
jgi:hypothetical protein